MRSLSSLFGSQNFLQDESVLKSQYFIGSLWGFLVLQIFDLAAAPFFHGQLATNNKPDSPLLRS